MILLKQSVASQEVPLGHFVDETDGKTAETGLTIANTDIKVWKNGATTLANKNSGGATHISGGIYYAVLDATDTDTLGPLVLFILVSGALAVRLECEVVTAAAYAQRTAGTQVTLPKNTAKAAFVFMMTDSTNHNPATGKTVTVTRSIDGATFASGTLGSVTEISDGLYKCDFGAGDLNGDQIIFKATATGCDVTFKEIWTSKAA